MKKTVSLFLAVLMTLQSLGSIAFADASSVVYVSESFSSFAENAVIWQRSDGTKVLFAYNYGEDEQIIEMNGNFYNVSPKSFADFEL